MAPSPTLKTFVFKPNPVEEGHNDLRAHAAGGLFQGSFHRIIKNERAAVVWEAGPCDRFAV